MGLILLICFEQYFEQHNFVCVCKHLLNMLYHILSVRVNIVFILSKFVSSVMLVFCTYRSFKHVNVPDLTQPCNEESYLSYPKAFIDGLSDYLLFFLHLHQCWNTQNTKQQWLLIYIWLQASMFQCFPNYSIHKNVNGTFWTAVIITLLLFCCGMTQRMLYLFPSFTVRNNFFDRQYFFCFCVWWGIKYIV